MNAGPTASTRLLALLGDPVSHSLSPVIQNAAIRNLGLDAVYVALRCSAAHVAGLVRGIALAGGAGNVTVPHKEVAAVAVDRRTEAAERTGACNAFWAEDDTVCADNTDVEGVSAAAAALLGRPLAGADVLVLGAGGAARAAVYALVRDGAARVVVLNRTVSRAREVAERFAAPGVRLDAVARADALRGERFDLAVNATSLGLHVGDPLALDPATGEIRAGAALDLVYSADETEWVRAMRAAGVPAADGKEMLLQQGAAAFRRWFSLEPPLEVMRQSLASAGAP